MTAAFGSARPVVMLVTDGERLAPGVGLTARIECLIAQARHAVEAGIDVVQIREPGLEAGDLFRLTASVVAGARGTATVVLVNDRVDVALAAGAGGVHLRADSPPVSDVRSIAPAAFLIGRSVHGIAEAAAAGDADYLVAGTVFPTDSKPGIEPLGVRQLAAIAARVRVPVLAIGGVTVERAAAVAAAGAAGVAAIGLFQPRHGAADGGCRAAPLQEIVAALRTRFDSPVQPS